MDHKLQCKDTEGQTGGKSQGPQRAVHRRPRAKDSDGLKARHGQRHFTPTDKTRKQALPFAYQTDRLCAEGRRERRARSAGRRAGGRGERTEHRAPGRPGGGAAARGSARARALFHPLPSAGHPGPGHLRARTGLRPTSGPRGARPHRGLRSGHTRGRPGRTPAGEPSAPEERTTPGAALHADRTRRSGPAQRAPPWGKWRHRWQQDQAHGPLPAPDQDPGGAREPLQQHWRRRVLRVGSGQDHGAEPRLRVCELLRARRCRRSRPHPQRPRTAGEDRQDSARDSSSHLSCARSPPGGGGGGAAGGGGLGGVGGGGPLIVPRPPRPPQGRPPPPPPPHPQATPRKFRPGGPRARGGGPGPPGGGGGGGAQLCEDLGQRMRQAPEDEP